MTTTEDNNNEPETAIVRCGTSAGPIVLKFYRDWSPFGYDRAIELFERGFYDDSHFFRAVPNFLVQFGISYTNDEELKKFAKKQIKDDPQLDPPIAFKEGTISYAGNGPDSRTSQLFIAYKATPNFGTNPWETPLGEVIEGMDHAKAFYSYGDMPPWGNGPKQGKIYTGPSYIEDNFPKIDRFQTCDVERSGGDNSGGGNVQNEQLAKLKNNKYLKGGKKVLSNIKNKTKTFVEHDLKPLASKVETEIQKHPGSENIAMGVIGLVIVLIVVLMFRGKRGEHTKKQ